MSKSDKFSVSVQTNIDTLRCYLQLVVYLYYSSLFHSLLTTRLAPAPTPERGVGQQGRQGQGNQGKERPGHRRLPATDSPRLILLQARVVCQKSRRWRRLEKGLDPSDVTAVIIRQMSTSSNTRARPKFLRPFADIEIKKSLSLEITLMTGFNI